MQIDNEDQFIKQLTFCRYCVISLHYVNSLSWHYQLLIARHDSQKYQPSRSPNNSTQRSVKNGTTMKSQYQDYYNNRNINLNISLTVMATPQKLEQQINNRINNQSPTKYDIDFYKRKVSRLENDCNCMQDDLNKARIRLRRAEDYELKYEMILKQNSNLQADLERKEKQLCQKKSEMETLKNKVQDKSSQSQDWTKQRLESQRQVDKWKVKFEQAEEKRINSIFQNREKQQSTQRRELQTIKKELGEKEENYQLQVRQLKKTINEKENIEGVISNRVEKVRNQKDEQIRRLQDFIEKQRKASDQTYQEKSGELDSLREKFQKIFNFQLENLRKSVDDQDELFNIELNGFREMISLKNDQISQMLGRLKDESEQHQAEREELQTEISMLKQRLYVIEREHELELDNIRERLTKIHASDIQASENRYSSLYEGLKEERKQFERQLKQKEKMVESDKREYERMQHEMYDRLKERDARIEHLQERIAQSAQMNENETKNLHQSFHQIESEKELMSSEYQTNVGFLNQQIAKMTLGNQTLNATIKGLQEEMGRVRREYTESMQELQLKWREERKQYEQEKQHHRERLDKVQDDQREKERVWKVKEKQLERLREKEEREKNKLQFIIDEMERDTERLNNYIKQLDDNLKRELKKNQTSTLDTGGIRRQLNAELERQKSDLQAIKRMEVDQIRKKMEIELTRLMGENQKLQSSLLQKTLGLQNLEAQFKKLEHVNKNIDKINREKLIEYEKKMATLNSEINITQTLYHKFMEAKAKDPKYRL